MASGSGALKAARAALQNIVDAASTVGGRRWLTPTTQAITSARHDVRNAAVTPGGLATATPVLDKAVRHVGAAAAKPDMSGVQLERMKRMLREEIGLIDQAIRQQVGT